MRTVWKVQLPKEENIVDLPVGASPLHAGFQLGTNVLWVLVDPDAELEPRCFHVAMTGEPINIPPLELFYVDTINSLSHVFERRKSPLSEMTQRVLDGLNPKEQAVLEKRFGTKL